MKLLETSQGFIFAFGFDMVERKPNPRMVCWCDPSKYSWEASPANLAGSIYFSFDVAPEFVREISTGLLIAYQSGVCLEFRYVGPPTVWTCTVMRSDEATWLDRAA